MLYPGLLSLATLDIRAEYSSLGPTVFRRKIWQIPRRIW